MDIIINFLAEILDFIIDFFLTFIEGRLFSKKKEKTYDKENTRPVLKCSICSGEQVARFKDIHTGKFEEVMLIRGEKDLKEFMETYGIETVSKEY